MGHGLRATQKETVKAVEDFTLPAVSVTLHTSNTASPVGLRRYETRACRLEMQAYRQNQTSGKGSP